MLDSGARKYVQPLFTSIAKKLAKLNITPCQITVVALVLGLAGSISFYYDVRLGALALLWISGFMDVLDGSVARVTDRISPFGMLMDLIFDRLVEMAFIIVVALKFLETRLSCVFLLCSIIFSFSIFLTVGAVVEKETEKSFYYQAGLAERTETFIIFSLVILLPPYTIGLLYAFTAMIVFTGCQRLVEAYRYFGRT
jgi:phosphatidylglycerophosphate synthase